MTPRMRKALNALADGRQPDCGLPTQRRLVKFGYARWIGSRTLDEALQRAPLQITKLGLEAWAEGK